MNLTNLFQIKSLWDRFTGNHPKFLKFLQAAAQSSVGEGTIIEVKITNTNQDSIAGNIRLTADDMEILRELKGIVKGM